MVALSTETDEPGIHSFSSYSNREGTSLPSGSWIESCLSGRVFSLTSSRTYFVGMETGTLSTSGVASPSFNIFVLITASISRAISGF